MRLDPDQLATLSAVLRLGSFDAAAAALHVTPPAVSQRIKALENAVGTALIVRGSPCTATPVGARLARHADEIALLTARLADDLGQQGDSAPVRMAVNADSLATWLLGALAQVPHMSFALEIDDQDHSAEWLRSGQVSAAITAHAAPVQGCDTHALGSLPYIATASPWFVARWFPDGPTPAALARAPMMAFNSKDRLQHRWIEKRTGQVLMPPTHLIASSTAFVEAARLGLGWGMNPASLVQEDLASGALVALDADTPLETPLYWQVARHVARALDPLTRAIRATARAYLTPT